MATKKKRGGDQLPMDFMLPTTTWEVPSELPDLRGIGSLLAVDSETRDDGLAAGRGPGWVYRAGRVVGVSMAVEGRAVYAPIAHPETECFPQDAVARWVRDHFAGPQRKVFHNAPYDLGWLSSDLDVPVPDDIEDTMGMAFMLDENRLEYNLDATARWQGIPGKNEELLRQAASAYGVDPKAEMWKLPARYVGVYGEDDAVATLGLAQRMLPQLEAGGLMDAYRLEMDLIPMCMEMRRRGVRINMDRAAETRDWMLARRDDALQELSELAPIGRRWDMRDVNSDGFLAKIFDAAQIPYPRTAKGNNSFSAEWMEKRDERLPQLVVLAGKMHDAGDKFVGNYLMNYTHMGRIHAEIHQFKDDRGGTVTTRFSYSDPPLQQMPSRNPTIATRIRGLFLPEPGEVWGALDYSQQEFRLMVHFASVCGMAGVDMAVRMYRDDPDTDFHDLAAKLTRLPRRRAKDVNFAKAFGAGKDKFAAMTGMSVEEAVATMEQYDQELPFIKRLGEFCQQRADQRGYIRMLDGARGRFDRWEPRWVKWDDVRAAQEAARAAGREPPKTAPCDRDEALARVRDPDHPWSGRLKRAMTHKAMNKLIQGSAARQTKMAMRQCWREGIVPALQMHDELDFSFGEEGPALRAAQIMTEIVTLEVPCKVDAEFGIDWGSAAKEKDRNGVVTYDASWASAQARLRAA